VAFNGSTVVHIPDEVGLSCLEGINRAIVSSEITEGPAGLMRTTSRGSTRRSYDARLRVYLPWYDGHGVESTISMKDFCDFYINSLRTVNSQAQLLAIERLVEASFNLLRTVLL
jgi:hypothetical protein